MKTNYERARDFYLGFERTNDGYLLEDILNFNSKQFEREHHFIQWLFPINTVSVYNFSAPVLTKSELAKLGTEKDLREKVLLSLHFVCKMYGLEISEKEFLQIRKSSNFTGYWITIGNHNYKRLTRILICLKQVGLTNYADCLYNCLMEIAKEHPIAISPRNKLYWKNAIKREV